MSRALYLFVREGVAKDIEPKPRGLAVAGGAATPPEEQDEAKITIGKEGGDKVFPYHVYSTLTVEVTFTEVSRETKTKRVENPDDPSQYVNVEQIEKLKVKNDADPNDKRTLKLKNPKGKKPASEGGGGEESGGGGEESGGGGEESGGGRRRR